MFITGDPSPWWTILMWIGATAGVSYNEPKFCPNATWNASAITFANSAVVDRKPSALFINSNNTVYVASYRQDRVCIWPQGNNTALKTISGGLLRTYSMFVASWGDIYVDNGDAYGRVEKFAPNGALSAPAMSVPSYCPGLFVDINNILYCSLGGQHKIIKKSLSNSSSPIKVAAGTGSCGSTSNTLCTPNGIFVDTNFDLYVADSNNDRVQRFRQGQSNGSTVAGWGLMGSFTLSRPTGVVLDGDKNLFIVEYGNNRIIASGLYGFRCIVGCLTGGGSAATELDSPRTMAFDVYGNIFVADEGNDRIQKFILRNTSCDSTTLAPTTTSISTGQTTPREPATSTTEQQTPTGVLSSTTMMTTSVANVSHPSCAAPHITLIPSAPALSSPMQIRRSQDFYFISLIQLNCDQSLTVSTNWTITNCTSTCSHPVQLDNKIFTTSTELFIPARTLPYGIYELVLSVTMVVSPWLATSSSVYVQITPSGITANLVQYGTSMITSGHQQDLVLNPGAYSMDWDDSYFNATNWKYEYYCRIYGLYTFPNVRGSLIPIDDTRIDSLNPSCLDNRTAWKYHNPVHSSMAILARSLRSNRTYQFMVHMENRQNSSNQATGYLLVKVEDTPRQLIVIGCVIATMCVPNLEFQLVNPTTQVALFSQCLADCPSIDNITWHVYYGSLNSSSNVTKWTLFNHTSAYENRWFFGRTTSNFTSSHELFVMQPAIDLWRFEVVYRFQAETSSSALNFVINQAPFNGSCSISPLNGTTNTQFTVFCPDWFDEDGIRDYSLFTEESSPTQRVMVAFSPISTFEVRLPAGKRNTSSIRLIVFVRDKLDCVREVNLTSVTVIPDASQINSLIDQKSTHPIVRLLSSANQNTAAQIINSLAQQLNQLNDDNLDKAHSMNIPLTSISISHLGSAKSPTSSTPLNNSAWTAFTRALNVHANLREYLMNCIAVIPISTSSSIRLQGTVFAQLTQSTNQLTRSSTSLASSKCYQLAKGLNSMAGRISSEDVRTAAEQISQCSANVLTAINAPLQQRSLILDSDFARANQFPDDYDTDLESEWANFNRFGDGEDFSSATIEKNRNRYFQKQAQMKVIEEASATRTLLTSALSHHLNIGQIITINTSAIFLALETVSTQAMGNKLIQPMDNAQIQLPSNFNPSTVSHSSVSLRSIVEPLAPADGAHTNLSTSVSFSILDRDGNELSLRTSLDHPYRFLIPRDPNLFLPPMALQNVTALNGTPHHLLFNLHHVDIMQSTNLTVSVHIEMQPMNSSLAYLFVYTFDGSLNAMNHWSLFCPASGSTYTYLIDNQFTEGHRSLVFGLRELNVTEMNTFCSNPSTNTTPLIPDRPFHFTSNYGLRVYTSGCYYLDSNNHWQSDGLVVGPLTNHEGTECFSTHLTTFAGGFLVLPTPVNWNYVFANADFSRNKTIYVTVILASILYVLLILYARYKDRKDLEKLGVTSLPDNYKEDQYCYQIIVFTGHRRDAGTKSKVYFIVAGEQDETHVRTLADSNRTILQRGGIDSFVMTVPKSLGPLNYIRLWHDNEGAGTSASWFLKYVIVRDLQTLDKSYFICQRWLAVDKDDGRIERLLPIASELQKREFSYVLSKQAYHNIADDHLWFSIFSRPPSHQFTRVQRCTCCFVLLFTSMLLNILYYDQMNEAKTNTNGRASLSLGPLYITPEQIGIGVIVELLVFVPSLLLIQCFRRIRPKRSSQQQSSALRRALYQIKRIPTTHSQKKPSRLTLPWWCLFLAYGFSLVLTCVSIFFIIVRGIEFGDLKTQKWLTSLITGFFSSILLLEPIKILCLTIFFACFLRKSDNDKQADGYLDDSTHFGINDDEEYLQSTHSASPFSSRPQLRSSPRSESELAVLRSQRLKELKMWTIVREVFTYVCFLSLLNVVVYSNQNAHQFHKVNHLRRLLSNSQISTLGDYWEWLEDSFVGNIRAQPWYNGDAPRNLSGFFNDKTNRLIGWASMRQLRVKSEACLKSSSCRYDRRWTNEERGSFPPGWSNQSSQVYSLPVQRAFQYRSGGYVYEFRGRLADLRSNLSALHRLQWIDGQTRLVTIQFTLYNPNVELFTSGILATEFHPTGGLSSHSRFDPLSFRIFASLSQLLCTIAYMMFVIYLMVDTVQSMVQLKTQYFHQFRSFVDMGIIICSWASVGLHGWRYKESNRIGTLFQDTNGYSYIDLQRCVYINETLQCCLSAVCFLSWIKLVRLCRFNRRITLFVQTLRQAAKELLAFSIMFSIVFVAFVCLFYLLFLSKLGTCSSLFRTSGMLFEMMLMKFDAYQLIDASSFLGPCCFALFIVLVVFVCLSMFITIINDQFRAARDRLKLGATEDEQMMAFMIEKVRRWIGKPIEWDEAMREKYYNPAEHFPEKIDQLLDALDRIYVSQQRVPTHGVLRKQCRTSWD